MFLEIMNCGILLLNKFLIIIITFFRVFFYRENKKTIEYMLSGKKFKNCFSMSVGPISIYANYIFSASFLCI